MRTVKIEEKDFIGSGFLEFRVPKTPVVCIPVLEVLALPACGLY